MCTCTCVFLSYNNILYIPSLFCRFLNQHGGYRSSDILAEASVEEDNPDDDLYATYAMLHTHRTE